MHAGRHLPRLSDETNVPEEHPAPPAVLLLGASIYISQHPACIHQLRRAVRGKGLAAGRVDDTPLSPAERTNSAFISRNGETSRRTVSLSLSLSLSLYLSLSLFPRPETARLR